jgi:hypothetical protein
MGSLLVEMLDIKPIQKVAMMSPERQLEEVLVKKLGDLKYEHRTDIRDRDTLEKSFCEEFNALNRVQLTDAEFQRVLEEIITPVVFCAAHTLRNRNSFTRHDGTPLEILKMFGGEDGYLASIRQLEATLNQPHA